MKALARIAVSFAFLAASVAVAGTRPVGPESTRGLSGTRSGGDAVLPVTLTCASCTGDQEAVVSLLWRQGLTEVLRSVRAIDWAAGRFEMVEKSAVGQPIEAERVDEGWTLRIPLGTDGLPLRVVVSMPGHVAQRAAYWPSREPGVVPVFALEAQDTVLDRHPAWDPRQTDECDVVIPKTASLPLTFYVEGQPRAWLFRTPSPAADGAQPWTFQFTLPNGSLLDRMSVGVDPADDGSTWAFRLPLQAVLGETGAIDPFAAAPPSVSHPVDASLASSAVPAPSLLRRSDVVAPHAARPASVSRVPAGAVAAEAAALGPIEVSGLGPIVLNDCPRSLP